LEELPNPKVELEKLTVKELRKVAKERGISVRGSKANIIERLKNQKNIILEKTIGDLNFFKNNDSLPHFYTPINSIISPRSIEDLPRIVSSSDWQIRSAVFFGKQNADKIGKLESLSSYKVESENDLPTLEFRKINPTKYRVRVHSATGEFPLVFSESFHEGWRAYLTSSNNFKLPILNFKSNINNQILNYKTLDGNTDDQASKEEVIDFIQKGYVTDLGSDKEKTVEHKKWGEEKQKEELDYVEKYSIDFVSKNFQGTIQNDNLPVGNIFETWLPTSYKVSAQGESAFGGESGKLSSRFLDFTRNDTVVELPEEDHLMVNGYANSWIINTDELCNNPSYKVESYNVESGYCVKNADGSYDFEMVVEFWPQRLFYVGVGISGTTLLLCLAYLGYDYYRRKKYAKIKENDAGKD
ncbi:SAP domain-containing protein, partial [Patescibacteria group bacterium]|nr:SAP domain-containing protein [Patescibacteria group bacterium]